MPCVGRFNTYSSLGQSGIERHFVSSAPLLLLAIFYLLNLAAVLLLPQSSIAIFMLTALLNLLTACLPPLTRRRCTRLSSQAHSYTVQIPYGRVNQYILSFVPVTGKLWNSLPYSVFPHVYDLNAFKRGVSRHLCNQKLFFLWLSL